MAKDTVMLNVDLRGPGMAGFFKTTMRQAAQEGGEAARKTLEQMTSGKAVFETELKFEKGTGEAEIKDIYRTSEKGARRLLNLQKKSARRKRRIVN